MTKRIFFTGIVQGVGFRPTAKRLADRMGLSGTVKNLGSNAEIVIHAEDRVTDEFISHLVSLLPNEARIDSISVTDCEEFSSEGFTIVESRPSFSHLPEILPDIATCKGCIEELFDKNNRRYRHPFISCTACGPRYSIIRSLPYDRENTLMDIFPLCKRCEAEYVSLEDRRLHAQTVACKECGPALSFYPETESNPIYAAADCLKQGKLLAVKDIGGYHFACTATDQAAVASLRELKLREAKPFAVMFKNIDAVKEYCRITTAEEELLTSSSAPIVLVEKKKELASGVCDGSRFIGAMLPSNPVQHLLLQEIDPLVMTSGNISGEPIITDNDTVLNIAKANKNLCVLYHDRDIITPLDDSIYYVIDEEPHLMRRGRGVAPRTIPLNKNENTAIFASGGDLKASFGFYKNGKAILSQHFGDLEDSGSADTYKKTAKHIENLFSVKPDKTITDMHPAYYSSSIAEELYGTAVLKVQHHHAHIASVMAEHSLDAVLGFALDGTGYGTDGSIWGGEALLCEGKTFKRIAHLKSVKMCSGDEISKNAVLALFCYLSDIKADIPKNLLPKDEAETVKSALSLNINCFPSSSCGRLFDAAACLLGLGAYNRYEGECAIKLENAANTAIKQRKLAHRLELVYNNGVLDTPRLLLDMLKAKEEGADINSLALGFHYALADGFLEVAKSQNMKKIALSGGCFNNRILTSYLKSRLKENGFYVYLNHSVPCGDGGVALGQIYLGV